MKILNKITTIACILIVTVSLSSCNKNKQMEQAEVLSQVSEIKHVETKIEGMTCEIGCAKLIASKISKLDGVTDANVDFESNTGQFSYDASIISKDKIISTINNIAGGETYKVVSSKEVSGF